MLALGRRAIDAIFPEIEDKQERENYHMKVALIAAGIILGLGAAFTFIPAFPEVMITVGIVMMALSLIVGSIALGIFFAQKFPPKEEEKTQSVDYGISSDDEVNPHATLSSEPVYDL